jgi:hypothetical protein
MSQTSDKPKRLTVHSCLSEIKETLGEAWLLNIYQKQVRSLRTRSFNLNAPNKENDAEIMHTLLGVELQVGRKRIACPDLATARYLAVFARIGCSQVALPYEINRISVIADALESSWQRMLLLASSTTANCSAAFQRKVRKALIDEMRNELLSIGSGPVIPQFNQNTKQRKS